MGHTASSYAFDDDEFGQENSDAATQETTPGEKKEIQWEVVAEMPGLMPATIVAGRLQSEGIPARAWQEGAGQALGLTVGLLGTGYVLVPAELVDQALAILEDDASFIDEEE